MAKVLDTVLLLALPASGKSEVRRYLAHLSKEVCRDSFHMGETVQLDDFPYVHLMRRIDDELQAMGKGRLFFEAADRSFINRYDWGTLIHLVNEDYVDLLSKRSISKEKPALSYFSRIDAAGNKAGIAPRLESLGQSLLETLSQKLDQECLALLNEKIAGYPDTLEGKTLVIEFARGGPDGAEMPLQAPHGYAYSISQLSPAILEKAAILYVWVTPEESRRKNFARANPNDPGSILHHGVPLEVMLGEYGCDDMSWLEQKSPIPGRISIEAHGHTWSIPIGRFDNRVDKTSFLRAPVDEWSEVDVKAVHEGIKSALDCLVK